MISLLLGAQFLLALIAAGFFGVFVWWIVSRLKALEAQFEGFRSSTELELKRLKASTFAVHSDPRRADELEQTVVLLTGLLAAWLGEAEGGGEWIDVERPEGRPTGRNTR